MCLFLEAANTWSSLSQTSYELVTGRKGKLKVLKIDFRKIDFDHLAGMQYANDVDFVLHRREYRGDNLIPALVSGKIDATLIEKSKNFSDKIFYRLCGICTIPNLLDSDFSIYAFNAEKLPFISKLDAKYLIYNERTNTFFFLFLDRDDEVYYCKSIFYDNELDYRKNQTPLTILRKTKIVNGNPVILYQHPKYEDKQ